MNFRRSIKKLISYRLFRTVEPWGHWVEAVLANIRYGFPSRNMKVIGVTGTNGKTTTACMIQKMLSDAGYKTALMTTVSYGIDNDITPQTAHMTTVSAPLLQRRLREFKNQGAEWAVVEVTSHALAQHRVWGIPFQIAVMTNVTHEHLDYHGTFARYLAAKRRLFSIAAKHGQRLGIVNLDDQHADAFLSAVPKSVTYGMKSGDLVAKNVTLESDGSRYKVSTGDENYSIHCHIPGEFNVYNSLAAVAVGRAVGLNPQQIEQGIDALKAVEGRMTVVDEGQSFSVIVDFAHTPDSFERLLGDLRTSTKGKLVVLFGSAGRRDETKRAIQGKIAGKYADEVILTEEDDRDVDGNEILAQIAEGAKESGKIADKNLFSILDRQKAIDFAISRASQAADTVVLLGKGHEKTIERADGEHPWDEVATAREALRRRSA
jgi:UDP-N-acetylmuramoyl-L-alanyl-D-glutamate--2,6-diaminopimelate ligase